MNITRIDKPGARQAAGPDRDAKPRGGKAGGDRVSLSAAALRDLEAQQNAARRARQAADAAKAAGDGPDVPVPDRRTEAQCRKIAARIRAGDHVPLSDRRFLESHDAMGYQMAMALRHIQDRPRHREGVVKGRDAHRTSAAGVSAVLAADRPYPSGNGDNPFRDPSSEEDAT